MKFRKRPVVIDAALWLKNGDHPQDDCVPVRRLAPGDPVSGDIRTQTGELVPDSTTGAPSFLCEGAVVRYYRRPDDPPDRACEHCARTMHEHGWIQTLEGGHIVCPGDWVIRGVKGEYYPIKADIFAETYDCAEEGYAPHYPWHPIEADLAEKPL